MIRSKGSVEIVGLVVVLEQSRSTAGHARPDARRELLRCQRGEQLRLLRDLTETLKRLQVLLQERVRPILDP